MNRRTFTASLAGQAAAGPAGPVGAAVIGTGHGHALSKIRALRSMTGYGLRGICLHPGEPATGEVLTGLRRLTLREVIEDSSVELAVIESADVMANLDYAEKCAQAGKFVHLDKPPGASLPRLRNLFSEAARRGRIVQMGYQWRYHPAFQRVMEAARQGWLGSIYGFSASIDKLIDVKERQLLARFPGGMMFSEGCHLVDCAVAVLGMPRKVTGFMRHDGLNQDGLADNTLAILEYDRAIAGITVAGFHPRGASHRFVEVRGENGSARLQPYTFPSRLTIDLSKAAGPYQAGLTEIDIPAPNEVPYTPDFREMANVIRNGSRPTYSVEHDLNTHETLLRICGMLGPSH
ncbi:MAG: Gfo/Idh/MocA family oxidoreductase [Bryobacterales bacterium]|nr:Gfo/Idh/MocA family oxidoreductase [Bryobacterales bacterium]